MSAEFRAFAGLFAAASLGPAAQAQAIDAPYSDAPIYLETIRATPLYDSPHGDALILGTARRGEGPIEAQLFDRDAARVRIVFFERDAWLDRADLRAAEPRRLGPSALPEGLVCGGTEPFWGLRLADGDHGKVMTPTEDGIGSERLPIAEIVPAAGRGGYPAAVRFATREADLRVSAGSCSDGMSDRSYPWTATLLIGDGGALTLYEGCCRLPSPLDD